MKNDPIRCLAIARIGITVSELIEGSDVPIRGYCVNYAVEAPDEYWPNHIMRDQQDVTAKAIAQGYVEGEFTCSYAGHSKYDFDRYQRLYEPYRAKFFRIGIDVFESRDSMTPLKSYDTDITVLRRFFSGSMLTYFNILSLIEHELGGFSSTLPRLNNKQQLQSA